MYIGDSKNVPVKLLTSNNINEYLPGTSDTVPSIIPHAGEIIVGNTVIFANKPWIVVNYTSNEAILMLAHLGGFTTTNNLSTYISTWKDTNISEEQDTYLTGDKIFVPNKATLFAYQYASSGNYAHGRDTWIITPTNTTSGGGGGWWPGSSSSSTNKHEYIDIYGEARETEVEASLSELIGFRPFAVLDVTKLPNNTGAEIPEAPDHDWPAQSSLTLGNTVAWAGSQWVVSHVTAREAYLTLLNTTGVMCKWISLQDSCNDFAKNFTSDQKLCLKSKTADETQGIVFVATYDQMNGGFSYFNSNARRAVNTNGNTYWTSTFADEASDESWNVYCQSGTFTKYTYFNGGYTNAYFRPSVCIDLTKYS